MSRALLYASLLALLVACGRESQAPSASRPALPAASPVSSVSTAPTDERAPVATRSEAAPVDATVHDAPATAASDQPDGQVALEFANQPWQGDLDAMIERRLIRVLVPYSKTFYFLDGGTQRGLSYELMQSFDVTLNEKRKLRLRVATIYLPVSRDQLLDSLRAGLGDVAAANLTVTPSRARQVDFTQPLASGVREIVVAAPGALLPATVDELSGKEVFVRRASSYFDSLTKLNTDLLARGRPPVMLREAPPTFEDEDVLEMVNAGLVQYTVVDRYLATFWSQIYRDMQVADGVTVREAGDIAFAIRKDSPQLKAALDTFIVGHRRGTTFGNVVIRRYLQNTRWVKDATSESERRKFTQLRNLFRKYGDRYDVDWILMAAQGYQESGLDQRVKSRVGAIGIMQIMPATGTQMHVGDIRQLEPNIHAGVKYIRFMIDQYYQDDPMDDLNKALFAFASYNAGPNRIRSLRTLAAKRGLDPDKWFNNVERIVAEKIGRETVQYVSNIYKYYIAYTLIAEQRSKQQADLSQ